MKAEELFVALLQNSNAVLARDWNLLEFSVVRFNEQGEDFLAIVENDCAKRGRGFFVFRQQTIPGIALQMPHSFGDLDTGNLGVKLFIDGPCVAAAWNTIPRKKGAHNAYASVDLARVTNSYFTAFARAFARCFDKGGLIQIHGFVNRKRDTGAGKKAEIIVSSGTKHPTQGARFLDACWEQRGSYAVRLYPTEVLELGGTRNATGRVFRSMNHNGFVHVELNRETRTTLLGDIDARRQFLECIGEVFR